MFLVGYPITVFSFVCKNCSALILYACFMRVCLHVYACLRLLYLFSRVCLPASACLLAFAGFFYARGSVITPVTAAAAATTGLQSIVRAPGP